MIFSDQTTPQKKIQALKGKKIDRGGSEPFCPPDRMKILPVFSSAFGAETLREMRRFPLSA